MGFTFIAKYHFKWDCKFWNVDTQNFDLSAMKQYCRHMVNIDPNYSLYNFWWLSMTYSQKNYRFYRERLHVNQFWDLKDKQFVIHFGVIQTLRCFLLHNDIILKCSTVREHFVALQGMFSKNDSLKQQQIVPDVKFSKHYSSNTSHL